MRLPRELSAMLFGLLMLGAAFTTLELLADSTDAALTAGERRLAEHTMFLGAVMTLTLAWTAAREFLRRHAA